MTNQPADGEPRMSSQDWIGKAVDEWGLGRIEVRERSALIKVLRQVHAAYLASLPQLQEMAKSIRLQICAATYAAEGGEWSNTSDEAIDAAINYHLAPLYAELDHAKAENGQFRAANAKFVAETAEKDATIDRLTKLLVDVRPYVKHDRLCVLEQHDAEDCSICKCGLKALLTSIDKEIGGTK